MQSHGRLTDRSGTITAGGTQQIVANANEARKYLLFQNTSDTAMRVSITDTAAGASAGFSIAANSIVPLIFDGNFIPTGAVEVYCATTGKTFTCWEG